jgi:hypothetical protein
VIVLDDSEETVSMEEPKKNEAVAPSDVSPSFTYHLNHLADFGKAANNSSVKITDLIEVC